MKKFSVGLIFFLICALQFAAGQNLLPEEDSASDKPAKKQIVLVELFTSEACAACPPAERLLAKLQTEQPFAEVELVTLAFHVDYMDGFGKTDKYASSLFTQRQRAYDRKFQSGKIYTPQMIVDGNIEFVGSKFESAEKAVKKSAENKKAGITITKTVGDRLKIRIENISGHEESSVYLAIAEDDISSSVRRGENAEKSLERISVVRSLKALGRIKPDENSFEIEINLQIQPDWKREKIKAIIFIQENKSRKILGVEKLMNLNSL